MSSPLPDTSHGSLRLIVGPMFSGKSTALLHVIHSYRAIGKHVLVINHAFNQRYDTGKGVTTHDGTASHSNTQDTCTQTDTTVVNITADHTDSRPQAPMRTADQHDTCLTLLQLNDLCTDFLYTQWLERADVVCVEELQFFPDAFEVVRYLVDTLHKHVVCAGLIADYRREPFGDLPRLMPYADDVKHVKALCSVCNDGTQGIFTQRLTYDDAQVVVGETDTYRTVCRKHYLCQPVQQHQQAKENGLHVNTVTTLPHVESDYAVGYGYDEDDEQPREESGAPPYTPQALHPAPWYVDDADPEYSI